MKNLKLFPLLLAIVVLTGFNSCKKCKNEDPRANITNNGTNDASVQIMTSGGNTVNINNIAVGTTSEYASYEPGVVTFTVKITGTDYVKTVEMLTCYEYNIVIDANNNIISTPHDRNE
jgi:hypothetical protein